MTRLQVRIPFATIFNPITPPADVLSLVTLEGTNIHASVSHPSKRFVLPSMPALDVKSRPIHTSRGFLVYMSFFDDRLSVLTVAPHSLHSFEALLRPPKHDTKSAEM